MVNITSKEYINKITSNKKEKKLLTQLTRCRTRKCPKITKEFVKDDQIFGNRLNKCPNTNFDCMKKVDKKYGPKSRRIYKKFIECGQKECSKENKLFKNYREILRSK